MKIADYRNSVVLRWCDNTEAWIAQCVEFPYLACDGTTPRKAIKELNKEVRCWLKILKEQRTPPPTPERWKPGKVELK